jgi:hypothetical protein
MTETELRMVFSPIPSRCATAPPLHDELQHFIVLRRQIISSSRSGVDRESWTAREIVAQFDNNSGKNRRAFGRAPPINAEGTAHPSFIKEEVHEPGKEPLSSQA